jgi:hypothetical protein
LATGFTAPLVKAFRAKPAAADFPPAATDGFDFATVFLDLATALAMRDGSGCGGWIWRALHHFGRFRASGGAMVFKRYI